MWWGRPIVTLLWCTVMDNINQKQFKAYMKSCQLGPCTSFLKVRGPISQNGDFYSDDVPSPKKSWFKISVKSVKPFGYTKRLYIWQLPIPYWLNVIMVTITSHVFINIFQTTFFSRKIHQGNKKNMSFLYQNLRKCGKNLKQPDRAPLSDHNIF